MEHFNQLRQWADCYETSEFISEDPIFFPHQYTDKRDIEISAFLTAWIAFGNRKLIIEKANEMDDLMHHSPNNYIIHGDWNKYKGCTETFYRMFTYHDFYCMCERLYGIYEVWEDMETAFTGSGNILRSLQHDFQGQKGIPDIKRNSPCKRLCLFLRWVCRKSPVDLGIWNIIHPSELYIPLDAHVAKMSRQLGITSRKTEDWKMVEQVTDYMRQIFPNDPCRGDFALFGYSINHKIK